MQEKQGSLSFGHFPLVHAPCAWGTEKVGETPRQGIKVKRAATFLLGEEGEGTGKEEFSGLEGHRDTEKWPRPKPGDQDLLRGHTEVRGESGLNRRSDQGQSSLPVPRISPTHTIPQVDTAAPVHTAEGACGSDARQDVGRGSGVLEPGAGLSRRSPSRQVAGPPGHTEVGGPSPQPTLSSAIKGPSGASLDLRAAMPSNHLISGR